MINFKYQEIGYGFSLLPGELTELVIENPRLYRDFVLNLLNPDEELYSLSEDGKVLSLPKNSIVITDLFDLDPNNKKVLSSIYKKIDRSLLSDERKVKFDQINAQIVSFLNDVATDFEGTMTFNDELTVSQLLGLIDFKFQYDPTSFFTSFISFIRSWREAIDLKIVFVLNVFSMLEQKEIDSFLSELSYLGVGVIDIEHVSSDVKSENVKKVVIDHDLCEIY
jgi:CRISPR type II-A-associated protein Csn2